MSSSFCPRHRISCLALSYDYWWSCRVCSVIAFFYDDADIAKQCGLPQVYLNTGTAAFGSMNSFASFPQILHFSMWLQSSIIAFTLNHIGRSLPRKSVAEQMSLYNCVSSNFGSKSNVVYNVLTFWPQYISLFRPSVYSKICCLRSLYFFVVIEILSLVYIFINNLLI